VIPLLEAVASFLREADRALVAGGGLGEVAQMALGIPQAVPGCCLEPAVANFRAQDDCLAAKRPGLLVVAEEAVVPADGVERLSLCRLGADGLEQAQRLLVVPERVSIATLASG
jgi:hypothetical protein